MNGLRRTLDIEIYTEPKEGDWHQAKYLVHGIDDLMWTDSKEMAVEYLLDELKRLEENQNL
jgi:hypothetical protein